MVDPPAWPERPEGAQDFDLFWIVRSLPPLPWPDESVDYGAQRATYGPPGTRWVFSAAELLDRQTAAGTSLAVKEAIKRLLATLKSKLPPTGTLSWATPEPRAAGAEPSVGGLMPDQTWIRTAIAGVIGTDESFVHILNWKHSTTEFQEIDPATLKAFSDDVRDQFAAFLASTIQGGPLVGYLAPAVRYTEVRTSHLRQTAEGAPPVWGPQTVVSPFTPASSTGTATGNALPYEVSMAISLNTNFRGTSRFRGRLYLPPMGVSVMTTLGQFSATLADQIGASFGTNVVQGVETATDHELHIVSEKYATSAKVVGVRMGEVPDSQRRRRRNRPESYTQVWGVPVGGAA